MFTSFSHCLCILSSTLISCSTSIIAWEIIFALNLNSKLEHVPNNYVNDYETEIWENNQSAI